MLVPGLHMNAMIWVLHKIICLLTMHTSKEKLADMSNSGRITLSDFKLQVRTTVKYKDNNVLTKVILCAMMKIH